ncbi:hypothetical protein [Azotobacter vinelandii]
MKGLMTTGSGSFGRFRGDGRGARVCTGWAPALIVGSVLVFSGWAMGQGVEGFRTGDAAVTVDGLTDLGVTGDFAVWTLAFRRSSDKFDEVKRDLNLDRDRIVVFLREKGFRPYEIEVHPLQALEPPGHEAALRETGMRFDGQGRVLVKTERVDALARVAGQIDPLIGAGIQFEAEPGLAAAVLTR